jgi:hypothetical protein
MDRPAFTVSALTYPMAAALRSRVVAASMAVVLVVASTVVVLVVASTVVVEGAAIVKKQS